VLVFRKTKSQSSKSPNQILKKDAMRAWHNFGSFWDGIGRFFTKHLVTLIFRERRHRHQCRHSLTMELGQWLLGQTFSNLQHRLNLSSGENREHNSDALPSSGAVAPKVRSSRSARIHSRGPSHGAARRTFWSCRCRPGGLRSSRYLLLLLKAALGQFVPRRR
jgi:hypothetical protein